MIIKNALGLTLIVILCCSNISCKQSTETSENVTLTLEKCYQDSSLAELENYLHTWYLKIRPVSQNELDYFSDPIKSIYQIYQSFYDPFNLKKYCTTGRCPEVGPYLYQDVDYIIIQMKIRRYTGHSSFRNSIIRAGWRPSDERSKSEGTGRVMLKELWVKIFTG